MVKALALVAAVAAAVAAAAMVWALRSPGGQTGLTVGSAVDQGSQPPAIAGARIPASPTAGQTQPVTAPGPNMPLGRTGQAVPVAAGSPPETMPSPVPLSRDSRDPAGAARVAAQQAADNERQLADSAVPHPGQELSNARVLPADIGLPFMPNAVQDQAQSSRTAEPDQGRTVSTVLHASGSLPAATRYYRQALMQALPRALLAEQANGAFTTLTATQPDAGTRVTVFLNAALPGELAITLSRWDSRDAAKPAAGAATGR